jgi:GDP-mannose 6-dehydrogenase
MVASVDEVLAHAEVIVVGNASPEFDGLASRLQPGQSLVDLVRIKGERPANDTYDGICW